MSSSSTILYRIVHGFEAGFGGFPHSSLKQLPLALNPRFLFAVLRGEAEKASH